MLSILSYGDILDPYALEDFEEYRSLYSAMTLIPTRVYMIKREDFQVFLEVI